ncbi:unnamed protein product [Brugia timori]|uniref:Bm13177, isoform b n=2 Tax=Brugia TaxID=6278 RepID=A0A1I9G4K8_BRUMA|nr:Bm13177, isoform b [Brugia malayi]VDO30653.1 unnamed protein product [Brugia timori]
MITQPNLKTNCQLVNISVMNGLAKNIIDEIVQMRDG